MRLSVIMDDGMVYVDGAGYKIKLDELPEFVHAVQWNGESGEIEYKPDSKGRRHPNVTFTDLTPYQYLVDRWNIEDERIRAEIERKAKEDEARNQEVAAELETLQTTKRPAPDIATTRAKRKKK